jgi:glycosyltransferase involved in cell wall biosynthesis
MNKPVFPKITFGIIVLNGEPFTRYCLRSIYPFAYEIIVVEGGHVDARSVCTPDGHSVDGTLESLYKFKKEEDPEEKLTIVTREGFWPKKDELGNDRTPQSRAYAERAKGDYLWQVDIDEFYRHEDMTKVLNLLSANPDITAVTFPTYTFWGDVNYVSGCLNGRKNIVT